MKLEVIEEGKLEWVPMSKEFYEPLNENSKAREGGVSKEDVMKERGYVTPAGHDGDRHPVLAGQSAARSPVMFGMEGVREWDRGLGMRYRSRRDLFEIATNPAFQGAHRFKIAGIKQTFAFPIDPWFQLGDPRLVLALVFLVIGLAVSWLNAWRAGP